MAPGEVSAVSEVYLVHAQDFCPGDGLLNKSPFIQNMVFEPEHWILSVGVGQQLLDHQISLRLFTDLVLTLHGTQAFFLMTSTSSDLYHT